MCKLINYYFKVDYDKLWMYIVIAYQLIKNKVRNATKKLKQNIKNTQVMLRKGEKEEKTPTWMGQIDTKMGDVDITK